MKFGLLLITLALASKKAEELAKLKSLYSSKLEEEVIEDYFEMCEYDIHKTSCSLEEMIDDINAGREYEDYLAVKQMTAEIDEMNIKRQHEIDQRQKEKEQLNIKRQHEIDQRQKEMEQCQMEIDRACMEIEQKEIENRKEIKAIVTNIIENSIENITKIEGKSKRKLLETPKKLEYWKKLLLEMKVRRQKCFGNMNRLKPELMKLVLKYNEEVDVSDGYSTPLLVAARNSQFDSVAELLKNGADPNIKEKVIYHGNAALHWAAEKNKPDIIAILLAYGADVDAKNRRGETPLVCAQISGSGEAISLLNAAKTITHRENTLNETIPSSLLE